MKCLVRLVQHGVMRDLPDPVFVLLRGRQLAEEQQVGDLQIGAMLGQRLDVVAAVAKDTFVAVNEGDAALARRRIHECGIVGHQTEVVGTRLDLPQIHGPDGAELDRRFVSLVVALVGDGQSILRHDRNLLSENDRMNSTKSRGPNECSNEINFTPSIGRPT